MSICQLCGQEYSSDISVKLQRCPDCYRNTMRMHEYNLSIKVCDEAQVEHDMLVEDLLNAQKGVCRWTATLDEYEANVKKLKEAKRRLLKHMRRDHDGETR